MANSRPKKAARTKATPARVAAFDVLFEVETTGCYLEDALKHHPELDRLPKSEKAFARLLASEVVARKSALALILSVLIKEDDLELETNVELAFTMALCELCYLDKPDHVVVDQGVELVRRVQPKATKLANYLLREACRRFDASGLDGFGFTEEMVGLDQGFPAWLADYLIATFGYDAAETFMSRSNKPAPVYFAFNEAKVKGAQLLEKLVRAGIKIAHVPPLVTTQPSFPCFVFAQRSSLGNPLVQQALRNNEIIISDQAAQTVAALAVRDADDTPRRMLEIGAGRGVKTMLIQNVALSRFGHQITLETLDNDERRTKERARRLKDAAILEQASYLMDAQDLSRFEDKSFDSVFIDAPCTGLGTLRRHLEIRNRVTHGEIIKAAEVGLSLLKEAARLVEVGGRLTYATCTITPEENDGVIEAFLLTDIGQHFKPRTTLLPNAVFAPLDEKLVPDGHFACLMMRVS